jgi:hypothetical protein
VFWKLQGQDFLLRIIARTEGQLRSGNPAYADVE